MSSLKGKTALITGASRGMGRATAIKLADEGAHVIVHYGNSAKEAQSVVDQIRSQGGKADLVQADISKVGETVKLAAETSKLVNGKLDIFVSNAGISKPAKIQNQKEEDFDQLFATNVRAPFFLLQNLLPILQENASVVVVTSLAARFAPGDPGNPGNPPLSAYASTKGALETLVRQWASQLGSRGIRVNAIAPGVIETDMSNFTKTDAGRQLTLNMQALKRIGQADDVADVIAFVASDAARWVTGASIPVDGGSKL